MRDLFLPASRLTVNFKGIFSNGLFFYL